MKFARLMMAAALAAGTMFMVTGCGKAEPAEPAEFADNGKTLVKFHGDKWEKDSYTIPDTVLSIGKGAFAFNKTLKRINLPQTIETIGDSAFEGAAIEEINLPPSLKSIGKTAFSGTQLKKIKIPGSVKIIPTYCFGRCNNLEEADIEWGVEIIGQFAFTKCQNLTSVNMPRSLTKMNHNSFNETPVSSLMEQKYKRLMVY